MNKKRNHWFGNTSYELKKIASAEGKRPGNLSYEKK